MPIRRFVLPLLLLCCAQSGWAQVQVRDAGTSRSVGTPAAAVPAQNNELILSLYTQLEALQQEVQTLRGVVEEQSYQLKRLQAEQKDRYLDVDRRLSALSGGGTGNGATAPRPTTPPPSLESSSAAANSAATVATLPPPPAAVATSTTSANRKPAAVENDLDEQELYRKALNLLLDDHKAEETKARAQESVTLFQTYIDNYPKGRWLTNALYWQGAGFLLISNPAKARDVLVRLMTEYPADAKAPGALLKLGEAYKQLGDKPKASETWKSIRAKYPEATDEAGKADENLKSL